MKQSVLVDFYNLELKDIEFPKAEELERIIGFFKIHAPMFLRKLTLEEKQRISELYYTRLRKQIVVKGRVTDEEIVPTLVRDFSDNGETFFNAFTTFQGFEATTGIPWFFSPDYDNFIEHYFKVKMLIDSYFDNHVIPKEQMNFLKSKLNTYMDIHSKMDDARKYLNNKDNEIVSAIITSIHTSIPTEMGIFTFPLWGLFDMIYSEVISVLEGKLKIGRCKRKDCNNNNILLKSGKGSGKRKYCLKCSNIKTYRENQNKSNIKKAKDVHRKLCDLIDKWLGRRDSMNVTAFELKKMLEKITKREGITDRPFLKGTTAKNLGQYFRYIKKMLEDEYGITYETDEEESGYVYSFKRVQL